MTTPEPTAEHRWLHQLLGNWSWTTEAVPGHDHPTMTGKEEGRSIGDIWVELAGDMGDHGPTRMTLGFNPATGRFLGNWVGGMMTHMWVYDGALSADGTTLVLEATGPAWEGTGTSLYRDVVQVIGPDERTLKAYVQVADGSWTQFMTTRYRREKV